MHQVVRRTVGGAAALALAALVVAGCSNDNDDDSASSSVSVSASADANAASVDLTAADGTKVALTGALAEKFKTATEKQQTDLGKPLTGPDAAGTSESGVMFQQFDGGVITAKPGSPAYITWGKIRDAWNVKRDATGKPAADGKAGSNGPLGTATSDETDEGDMKVSTFEHGKITYMNDKVEVTVNGTVVPAE